MLRIITTCLLLVFSLTSVSSEKVYLSSLEWPPYSGEQLPEGGASIAIAKKAFEVMGYELEVSFYPWSRAVHKAKDPRSRYAGYFPEYYSSELEADFYFSDVIGSGPLGLIENVDQPISWDAISDLSKYSVGVVRDYVNTKAFDQAVKRGEQEVQEVTLDKQNIFKVAGGRLPLAIIDHYVFDYLMSTDKSLANYKDRVQLNGKLLEDKLLFVCFKRNKQGSELQKIFNEGLSQLDVDQLMQSYFEALGVKPQ